jgi:eukaryotic-like serine/threonine-protein kinase
MGSDKSSALRLALSREVPRYRLVSRIATGGMSEVFLALMSGALGSNKPVVIKRLWPELASDPTHVQMFMDEARLSLRMAHPNVIHAFESGIDDDRHFLALEYLDGQSLKHLIEAAGQNGGLGLPLAMKIICDVLMALEYVHELQDFSGRTLHIVHRDVSPQNVFITYEGNVKLVDFGIAQFGGAAPASTRAGQGRVAYMAPEQLAGGPVDARADLFSVGVMLWELATGRRLWEGMSDAQIAQHLRTRTAPPPLPRHLGFPPGLASICAKALAPDPEQRYAKAAQLLFDLGQLLTGSMPIHTRLLGDLMDRLFSHARALSRAMIQQGLSDGTTTRITRELAAGTPLPRLGVVSDRSTSTSIAVPGDEVTLVDTPSPYPTSSRRRVRLLSALTICLAALAVGVTAGHFLARPPRLVRPPLSAATVVRTEPVAQPVPHIIPTDSAPVMTMEPPPPPQKPAKRPVHRAPLATPSLPTPTTEDPFEPRRPAKLSLSRPIDREDPYGVP